ncbi:MAG: hypothetical protein Q4D62_07715 [Planctomycetia bacterium]|nr:hypothetical protein [Planctomycetia bacterium]
MRRNWILGMVCLLGCGILLAAEEPSVVREVREGLQQRMAEIPKIGSYGWIHSSEEERTEWTQFHALKAEVDAKLAQPQNVSEAQWQEILRKIVPSMLEKVRHAIDLYGEFLPLTESQWNELEPEEKTYWEEVKKRKAELETLWTNRENVPESTWLDVLEELNEKTVPRPLPERVAPYRPPHTPEVVNGTAEEAQQKIEADWLFQADHQPTILRTRQEIGYAQELAERFSGVDFSESLQQLATLEKTLEGLDENQIDAEKYLAVRRIKRKIHLANPAIHFDTIVYVDMPKPQGSEMDHETRHRVGCMAVPGGRLMKLEGLSPDGKQTKLMPQEPLHGSFWRPDVSYDGKQILFCFKPHNEKAFHLYEINADGTGLRQITRGIFDDLDPIYLPDGEHILFLTARGYTYVRCMVSANSFIMARMKRDGSDLYLLSRNMESEYTPSVLNDGRIIYTRWEYTDKPLWRCQSLWTMNPDGTQVQTFWGNQSVWPDVLKDARAIPGSEKVMFTGCGHHAWFDGSVGIIDPGKGLNYPDGLSKATPDVPWAECGDGPAEKNASDRYHASGKYSQYYSPYPLSEEDFLVSAQRGDKFVLLLMDIHGNRELIHEGVYHIFHAIPLAPRNIPQVRQDQVLWPTLAEREKPAPGVIYSNNVYENAPEELRGKAKFLRIWSLEPKTYTMWEKRPYATMGPATSMVQSDGVKRILGTVPIEEDGSVSFSAPSGVALHFQLLDENHRALQTMRSFTGVMPGEVRGCLGCHESHIRSPKITAVGKAMQRAPSTITPVPWEDISVSFDRYVQPVLDKHCGKCHQNPEHEAFRTLNLTKRPGFLFFDEPYVTLTGHPTWGKPYPQPENPSPGFGWADTILVEGFHVMDPKAYVTTPPMTKLSYKSRLVKRMASGTHHDVKVTGEDLLRVILWVDAMCPYYGSEELRAMPDPQFDGVEFVAVKPRIQTAPLIPRPGPLDAWKSEKDPCYAPPTLERVNALPHGIAR